MKKIFTAFIMLIIAFTSFSQTKNFIDQPYIETIAEVDTLVTPDRIYMRIIITEKDTKGKVSVEELEKKMESTLKGLGIDTKKKLSLHDLASDFRKYFSRKKDILKSKAYTLLLEDAVTTGKVIIALEKAEISNVSIAKVEYSKIESLKLELKTKAILKAKQQAEAMVISLNQKVGAAIFISDFRTKLKYDDYQSETDGDYSYEIKTIRYNYKSSMGTSDIQFDKIKVGSAVSVKFKLE